MRTVTAAMAGHLAGTAHTRCKMLLIELTDGTVIGITDHDKDIEFDIGDGVETYSARTGILTSDVALSCGLDADNYEVTGPISDTVTLAAILGGRFNRARARLFQVNWKNLSAGAIKLLAGNVTEVRPAGGRFTMEVRSDVDRYNSTVGRQITNNCPWDFADQVHCHATPTEITGTVIAVTSARVFRVSFSGAYADNFFNFGTVLGLTGDNTGTTMEIFDWAADGSLELFAPMAVDPAVGDTFIIRDGCGKSRTDCMAHDNIVDFGGYPEVPGRKVMQPAIPGQGNS